MKVKNVSDYYGIYSTTNCWPLPLLLFLLLIFLLCLYTNNNAKSRGEVPSADVVELETRNP